MINHYSSPLQMFAFAKSMEYIYLAVKCILARTKTLNKNVDFCSLIDSKQLIVWFQRTAGLRKP